MSVGGGCVWAVVSTLAGGVSGTTGAYADASGINAGFHNPSGVAVDASGNVFVADNGNARIRKVTAGGGTRIGPDTLHARCADTDIAAPAPTGRAPYIDVDAALLCHPSMFFPLDSSLVSPILHVCDANICEMLECDRNGV